MHVYMHVYMRVYMHVLQGTYVLCGRRWVRPCFKLGNGLRDLDLGCSVLYALVRLGLVTSR